MFSILLLAFFFARFQGAMLSSIKPEYLLNTNDFKYFRQLENSEEKFQESSFELISKKSWSTLLLQIYKVIVLCCFFFCN